MSKYKFALPVNVYKNDLCRHFFVESEKMTGQRQGSLVKTNQAINLVNNAQHIVDANNLLPSNCGDRIKRRIISLVLLYIENAGKFGIIGDNVK